jgi:Tol biopolymer transport system component
MKRIAWMGAVAMVAFGAAMAQAVGFSMVSLRSDGTPPSAYGDSSDPPAITPNGRYVVFTSSSTNLVTPNAVGSQIYLRDRVAGTTELISVNLTGGGGNNASSAPSISDDGCRVAFMSFSSDLVAGDVAATQDVFIRDRCAQPATTSLVSVSSGGVWGNGQSHDGRISGDGSKVAFVSYATNLVSVAGAGGSCLFLRDLNARTTAAITAASGSCIAAWGPDLSRDASRMAFWAYNDPGTSSVINGVWQIYVYDFNAAAGSQPMLVSSSAAGAPQTQGSPGEGSSTITLPAISSDGGYVAFRSRGAGLVAVDGGGISHVYIKELSTGVIVRASVDSAGNAGNSHSSGYGQGYRPGLAAYAKTVTFYTTATNLAPETGGVAPNVVAHNPYTGQTIGFSGSKFLSGLPAITDGGEFIVAYSGFPLDPAFTSRGLFFFPALVAQAEFMVNHYYESILLRAPDAGGLIFWAGEASRIQRLGVNVNEVWFSMAGSFFTSAEYLALNRDNAGYITDLYTTFFNRVPDQAGHAYWKGLLDQGLPREVALSAFTFSPEFAGFTQARFGNTAVRTEIDTVVDFYRGILARLPDDAGFTFWLQKFRVAQCLGAAAVNAEVESISSQFAQSAEYAARNRSDAQFVGDLYNAFLRRGGDLAGVQYWISQVATRARTREQVRQQFVASAEFSSRVASVIAQGCLP